MKGSEVTEIIERMKKDNTEAMFSLLEDIKKLMGEREKSDGLIVRQLREIADLFEFAPRLGDCYDMSEGSRYIQISETKANELSSKFRNMAHKLEDFYK